MDTGVVLAAREIEGRLRVFSFDAPVGDAGQANASRRVPSIVQIRDRPLSCCLPQTKFTPISRLALRATSRNRTLSITCCAGATFIAFTMLPPSGTIVLARHELCTNYFKHAGICATLTAECSSLRHDYPDGTPRHYLPLSEAGGLWRAPHDVPATRQL